MSRFRRFLALAVTAGFGLAGLAGIPAQPAPTHSACGSAVLDTATCAVTTAMTTTSSTTSASPLSGTYSPTDLQNAYGFQADAAGMRQTIAVVTAYDDPSAESDLATYRSNYGLRACTTNNGCFKKTDQNGGTNYPGSGWTAAAAESVDMISAVCPNCHILLVEANDTAITNLGTAENTAVSLGAKFITNTYYTPEATYGAAESSYDSAYFNHPGVAITAPTGNAGYGVDYPAASPDVIAVGGTTLTPSSTDSRGWTETAWNQTGAGCSAYEAKPSWQTDTGCAGRTVADVSAVGDIATPVAIYDTGSQGWAGGGGTVVSAAIVAAAYALAGTPGASTNPASYPYAPTTLLNDITSGSDGTCSVSYLCTAGAGYDGPTGVGTPASTVPFSATGSLTGAIYNGEAGFCLDDQGSSTATDNPVQIFTCNGTSAQKWTVEADQTVRVFGSYCLSVYGGGTADGTKVVLDPCENWARMRWRPYAVHALINPKSGLCLDDPGGSTTSGTNLDISACQTWARQRWYLPYSVPTSAGPIVSGAASGMCVEDKGASTADGNTVWLEPCSGWTRQSWTVEANGTLQVLGVCMTDNGATTTGQPIQVHSCNGGVSQQWRVEADGSLANPADGFCIGLDNSGSTASGTDLIVWNCDGYATQRWVLPS